VSLVKISTVKGILYFRGWMKFCPYFLYFSSNLDKSQNKSYAQKFIQWIQVFLKICAIETTYCKGAYAKLCLCFIHLLSNVGEIWYKGSEVNTLEHLRVLWKLVIFRKYCTIKAVMLITSMGKLLCMFQKHHIVHYFFWEMIIPGILWVRTNTSVWLIW